MSTYTETHKRYYQKNKERVRERTREYRKAYMKEYYLLNRKEILRNLKKKTLEKAKSAILAQDL